MNKKIITGLKIFAASAAAVAVPVLMLKPSRPSREKKAPFFGRNFAHRGLHSRDKTVPENSLKAFQLAADWGYGVELDVHLSKDGEVVVFHDDDLKRVCGIDARVEDLTAAELKAARLYDTDETIPLLSEVLSVIDGHGPVICELKPGKNRRALCQKTYDIIKNYKGDICVESFHPAIVAWFRFHAPELLRGQLAMPMSEYSRSYSRVTAFILAHGFSAFITRPNFVAYKLGRTPITISLMHKMGALDFCWTSHEPRNEKGRDGVIFEYYKPKPSFK